MATVPVIPSLDVTKSQKGFQVCAEIREMGHVFRRLAADHNNFLVSDLSAITHSRMFGRNLPCIVFQAVKHSALPRHDCGSTVGDLADTRVANILLIIRFC